MDTHPLLSAPDADGTTVLVRRDALLALLALFEAMRYGPRGHEPTADQRAAGIATCVSAEHLHRLDTLTDTAEGHERHLRLALYGAPVAGVCAACSRYTVMASAVTTCEGR